MIRKFIFIWLVVVAQQLQAQVLEIQPKYPQAAQEVTIIYRPSLQGMDLKKDNEHVNLVFTSSTLYNFPWELNMTWKENAWRVSFTIPPYATFASFYFQNGKLTERPSVGGDYSLFVYKGTKRVKDSFFHESYSIKTQLPNAPDLLERQIALLRKELRNYPDNFEAKVRLKSIQMADAKTLAAAMKLKTEAREIIHNQFKKSPINAANLGRVAMGFNMIGEGYRTDSLKKILMQRYPESEAARSYLIALAAKQDDSVSLVRRLDSLVRQVNSPGNESTLSAYKILFKYAVSKGEEQKAIDYARKSFAALTPYSPRDFRDIALAFTTYKMAPDTAFYYAEKALSMIKQWPVGNIRNLPGFGYVLPYVEDSVRSVAIKEAEAGLFSLMALNKLYVGDKKDALDFAAKSLKAFENRDILLNAALVYELSGNYKKAYDFLWTLILKNPFDNSAVEAAKRNFLMLNNQITQFQLGLEDLQNAKNASLNIQLKQQLLDLPKPELNGITDLNGKPIDLELLKGKVVILDFWATWCVPCMKEMPLLQKVYDKYKGNSNVVFMVINTGAGNTIDDAKRWVKKNSNYTFPVYFNEDKDIGKKVGFSLIPALVLLGKDGKLKFRTVGFEGAEIAHKLARQIEILKNE